MGESGLLLHISSLPSDEGIGTLGEYAYKTIDFIKNENTQIAVGGRHDPAIIRRICPVIDSVTAIALCDLLTQRFGTDYLAEEEPLCNSV